MKHRIHQSLFSRSKISLAGSWLIFYLLSNNNCNEESIRCSSVFLCESLSHHALSDERFTSGSFSAGVHADACGTSQSYFFHLHLQEMLFSYQCCECCHSSCVYRLKSSDLKSWKRQKGSKENIIFSPLNVVPLKSHSRRRRYDRPISTRR